MNKYLKWVLIAFAIFAVLFAVGCTKSVLEEKGQATRGVMSSKPLIMPAPSVEEIAVGYDGMYEEPAMYRKYYDDGHFGSGEDIDVELKIVRTAHMSIEVDDYFLASQKVEAYARKYGGYVSNSDARAGDDRRHSGTVTIRVPEIHFDAVIAELSLLGEIESKSTSGNDVTEEYIDLQARINNSKAHETRLLHMYENATDVDEMMMIERELNRVREQIERNEGRLRYLNNRVEMSTITAYLYEPSPVVEEWGVWQSVKDALNHSLSTLRFMIELLGLLLPLIAVGVVVWLLIRWRMRKRVNLKRK